MPATSRNRPRRTPAQDTLSPRALQIVGIAMLIAFGGFWAVTERQSQLLVGAALTLITAGSVRRIREGRLAELVAPADQDDPDA